MPKQKKYVTNKRFNIQTTPSVDHYLNTLPKSASYKRKASTGKTESVDGDSRTEISVITTTALDSDFEVVMPDGINTSRYIDNPVVLYCHDYQGLPVGTCQWIKPISNGLKAKSFYPNRPTGFKDEWFIDTCFCLIQADVLKGKSIGFIETESHSPTDDEIKERPELEKCSKIIDACLLLEYSVVAVPSCPEALREKIAKQFPKDHLERLGIKAPCNINHVKEVITKKLNQNRIQIADLTEIVLKSLSKIK